MRAVAGAIAAGVGVGVYFAVWFGWPTFLALAVGATLAIVMLLFAASLADDPAAADAAWRAAAPDLAARERSAPDGGAASTPTDGPTGAAPGEPGPPSP